MMGGVLPTLSSCSTVSLLLFIYTEACLAHDCSAAECCRVLPYAFPRLWQVPACCRECCRVLPYAFPRLWQVPACCRVSAACTQRADRSTQPATRRRPVRTRRAGDLCYWRAGMGGMMPLSILLMIRVHQCAWRYETQRWAMGLRTLSRPLPCQSRHSSSSPS